MWGGRRQDGFGNRFRGSQRPNRNDFGAPFDPSRYMGGPQLGNLPYTADELRALADRMDASGSGRVISGTIASHDVAQAGRASQKPHSAADPRSQRGTAPTPTGNGQAGSSRSGSRGGSTPAPKPAAAAAPGPDAKPMLSPDAYIKRQQLRWLLKKRLGQIRDALKAMEKKGAQRTPASRQSDPQPVPGLFLPTIKGDFETTFATPLSYQEFGVEKLGQLLARECDDVLQEPRKVSQFMPMVKGQSTIPSAGETKAATRTAGRSQAPNLNQNTCMHVFKYLRNLGYASQAIKEYTNCLPQPKPHVKAGNAAKSAKQGGATAAEPQPESNTITPQAASPVAKEKGAKDKPAKAAAVGSQKPPAGATTAKAGPSAPAPKAGKGGQSKPAGKSSAGATPSAAGSAQPAGAQRGAAKGPAAAAVEAADAAETLAASDANVLGMASDDDDVLPVVKSGTAQHSPDGSITGAKRKAAETDHKMKDYTVHPKSTESTFWADHSGRELTEVEREFIVGLRARVYNRVFHTATFPCFVLPNKLTKRKAPKPASMALDGDAGHRLRLIGIDPVSCPKNSPRHTIMVAISPWAINTQRKGHGGALSCDVSCVLDHMLAELQSAEGADEDTPQQYRAVCDTVRAAPALFLGLAAMPHMLRQLPDGRHVAAPAGDAYVPTRCVAAKFLRQATVVSLLDTAPCMRQALGSGWGPSEPVQRRDGSGARVMCLHIAEVGRRIEALVSKELLKALLSAIRCESAKDLLASTHVADLVQVLPDDPEYACASFGPLLDLRLTLDRRLGALTRHLSAAAAVGHAEHPEATPAYTVPLLLRDHAMMWGYHFQPSWVGMESIEQVVRKLMGDMVAEVPGLGLPKMHVRPSPATMLRHMLRMQLAETLAAAGVDNADTDVSPATEDAEPSAEDPAAADVAEAGAGSEDPPAKARRVGDVAVKEEKEEGGNGAGATPDAEMADAEVADAEVAAAGDVADVSLGAADAPGPATEGGADTQPEPAETLRHVKDEPEDAAGAAEGARLRGAGDAEAEEEQGARAAEAEGAMAAEAEGAMAAEAEGATEATEGGPADADPEAVEAAAATADADMADAAEGQEEKGADDDVIMVGDTDDEGNGEGGDDGGKPTGEKDAQALAGPGAGKVNGEASVKQEGGSASTQKDAAEDQVEAAAEAAAATDGEASGGVGAEAEAAAVSVADGRADDTANAAAGTEPSTPQGAGGEQGGVEPEANGGSAAGGDAAAEAAPGGTEVLVIDDDDTVVAGSGGAGAAAAQTESGGSTAVAADAAGGDTAEEDETALEEDWVVVRTTAADLLRDFEACYGTPHPSGKDARAALRAVEWDFRVQWEDGDAVHVRDRACKTGICARLEEPHRAAAVKHMKNLFVSRNPQALLYMKARGKGEQGAGQPGSAAAKGGAGAGKAEVLGKRKEPDGGKAAMHAKAVKGAAGVRGKAAAAPVQVGRGAAERQGVPGRAGPGFAAGHARGTTPSAMPARRKPPMPRGDLRPVPVRPRHSPGHSVQAMSTWVGGGMPMRQFRPSMRPAVAPVPRRQSAMDSRGRADHWERGSYWENGSQASHRGGNEAIGGYIRGSGASGSGGGGNTGSHRGYQDLRRRDPSPVRGQYVRGTDHRRAAEAPGRRYSYEGGGSGRMSNAARQTGRFVELRRAEPTAREHREPAQVRYASDSALPAAGPGLLTVVPGNVYSSRQVVHSAADVMPAAGSRYATAPAAQEIQQLQPIQSAATAVQLLSAPAGAQAGAVYRLATVPGGGTVLINAGPAADGMPALQQTFTQAYAQYSVDGYGRVQQQQQAGMQIEELPVRRGSGSQQQYPIQDASGRTSRQYSQGRY